MSSTLGAQGDSGSEGIQGWTPTEHCQDAGSQPSSRDSSADVLRLAEGEGGAPVPQVLQCLGIVEVVPVISHGQVWAGWGF